MSDLIKVKELSVTVALPEDITKRIDGLSIQLKELPAITSQEESDNANKVLKEAKSLVSLIEAHRKEMTRPLDALKSEIMDYEKSIVAPLTAMVQVVNKNITDYGVKVEKERREREAEIQRQAQEKAEAEKERIKGIRDLITKFDLAASRTINGVALSEIDEKIRNVQSLKFPAETYQEFTEEMTAKIPVLVARLQARKTELEQLVALSTVDPDLSAQKAAEDEKNRKEEERNILKEAETKTEAATASAMANVQMESEMQSGLLGKSKLVRKMKYTGVVNLDLVPREYLTVDEKKVKEAVAAGVLEIPGLKIEEDFHNRSR